MFAQHHAKLVAAAQNGDGRAFDDLVAAHLPLLYNIVGRAVTSRADVDDIVQETLLRVVRDLPALRDPNSFRPWLVAIAVRQISTHRYRRRDAARAQSFEADEIADAAAGFEDLSVLRMHLAEQRHQAVDASRWLDPDHRVLLSLWWQECAGLLSRAELADAAGLTVAHAGVRLQRMREQLDLSRAIVAALAAQPRCASLDAALARWDGQRTSVWRKRIGRHVRGCPQCTAGSADHIPVERLLLTFAALPIPVGLATAAGQRRRRHRPVPAIRSPEIDETVCTQQGVACTGPVHWPAGWTARPPIHAGVVEALVPRVDGARLAGPPSHRDGRVLQHAGRR